METKIFLVNNGGDRDDYSVLALFTEEELADNYAKAAEGIVEEWTANVPHEKWTSWSAKLNAKKENGKWIVNVVPWHGTPGMDPISANAELGHYSGWGTKDPNTLEYTFGYANSVAQSEEQAKKMVLDAFWKKVAELEG